MTEERSEDFDSTLQNDTGEIQDLLSDIETLQPFPEADDKGEQSASPSQSQGKELESTDGLPGNQDIGELTNPISDMDAIAPKSDRPNAEQNPKTPLTSGIIVEEVEAGQPAKKVATEEPANDLNEHFSHDGPDDKTGLTEEATSAGTSLITAITTLAKELCNHLHLLAAMSAIAVCCIWGLYYTIESTRYDSQFHPPIGRIIYHASPSIRGNHTAIFKLAFLFRSEGEREHILGILPTLEKRIADSTRMPKFKKPTAEKNLTWLIPQIRQMVCAETGLPLRQVIMQDFRIK